MSAVQITDWCRVCRRTHTWGSQQEYEQECVRGVPGPTGIYEGPESTWMDIFEGLNARKKVEGATEVRPGLYVENGPSSSIFHRPVVKAPVEKVLFSPEARSAKNPWMTTVLPDPAPKPDDEQLLRDVAHVEMMATVYLFGILIVGMLLFWGLYGFIVAVAHSLK